MKSMMYREDTTQIYVLFSEESNDNTLAVIIKNIFD